MSTVVLLAPRGAVPDALLDLLRDWSALGLVGELFWVTADEVDVDASAGEVVAARVVGGGLRRARLMDVLASQAAGGVLRLVAVSSLGGEARAVPWAVARHLRDGLDSAVASGGLSPLHCVVARHGAGGWEPARLWPGWHRLLLAPEDSVHPGSQTVADLVAGGDEERFLSHAACVLAGLAGLWLGSPRGPYDDVRPQAESEIVVARAFVRSLDASGVSAELRRRLTRTTAGLPRPRAGRIECRTMREPAAASARAARDLAGKHAALLAVEYAQAPALQRERIGGVEALMRFAAFVLAVVRRAPGDALRRVKESGAAAVARTVQRTVYGGDDSRYQVVVAGVVGRGTPARPDDLARGAEDARQRVSQVLQPREHSTPDTSPFWRDVISVALTLADGADRVREVPTVLVDGAPAVVADVGAIAPAPDESFALPGAVAAGLGVRHVDPYDAYAHDQVEAAFSEAGARDLDVGRVRESFATWRSEKQATFAGQIARLLADTVAARRAELARHLGLLQRTQAEDELLRAAGEATTRGRSLLTRLLLGLLVVAGCAALLVALSVVSTGLVVAVAVGLGLSLTLAVLLRLYRDAQRLYAMIHAQRAADHDVLRHAENVRAAAEGLHVAVVLYRQRELWLPVLGRFLREPFGAQVPADPRPALDADLPLAMTVAQARPPVATVSEVAHELSRDLFECGWLGQQWDGLLRDAGRRLGEDGFALIEDPTRLYRDQGDAGSALERWSRAVVADGVSEAGGATLWQRVIERLQARPDLADRLLVTGPADDDAARSVTELMGSLGAGQGQQLFSGTLFTQAAGAVGARAVRDTVVGGSPGLVRRAQAQAARVRALPGEDRSGLDRLLVVVQLSGPLDPSALRMTEPRPSGTTAPTLPHQSGTDERLEQLQRGLL